jgi:hypothetical protein
VNERLLNAARRADGRGMHVFRARRLVVVFENVESRME